MNNTSRRTEAQARFDRLWKTDPQHLDPHRNVLEQERLDRSLNLLLSKTSLKNKKGVDLGCGKGDFTFSLEKEGAEMDAVDISAVALKLLKEKGGKNITTFQEYVPNTTLKDNDYDLVVCLELIAYLPSDEYRLLFSELARLVKAEGVVMGSTSLDIGSEDALQRYSNLVETEFQVEDWVLSYHRCWIRLREFLEAPAHFSRASREPDYRHRALKDRKGFSQKWFRWNSQSPISYLWFAISWLLSPLNGWIKRSRSLLLALEKFCKFFWNQDGISHAIFIGKRRPLFVHQPESEIPKVGKQKKQVWE